MFRKSQTDGVGTSLERTTNFGYDAAGNQTMVTDPLQHTTTTHYDALNRADTITDPLSQVVSIGYDKRGNEAWLSDPSGNKTHWGYDDAGRKTSATDPLGKVTQYGYDPAGNVVSITDRLGQQRVFGYDANDQVTSEEWYAVGGSKVQTQTFGYDENGNLTSATNPDGNYSLSYDRLNRPVTVEEPFGLSLTFGYDADGNRVSVTDNKAGSQTSSYDGLNRLTERVQAGMAKVEWGYDPTTGDPTSMTRSGWVNGVWQTVGTTTKTFDDLGRVIEIRSANASGGTLSDYSYGYDAADRVTSETDNGVTRTYSYDDTNQLTSDNGTGYSYDASGNRTNSGYVTGADNRLVSDGTWTYTYDDNGNLIKKSKGANAETWTYQYDQAGQMISASRSDTDGGAATATVNYSYDAFGNRIRRVETDGSGTVVSDERYGVDGWDSAQPDAVSNDNFDVYVDLDGANAVTARRVFGPGFDQPLARQDAAGTTAWYGTARLGAPGL